MIFLAEWFSESGSTASRWLSSSYSSGGTSYALLNFSLLIDPATTEYLAPALDWAELTPLFGTTCFFPLPDGAADEDASESLEVAFFRVPFLPLAPSSDFFLRPLSASSSWDYYFDVAANYLIYERVGTLLLLLSSS